MSLSSVFDKIQEIAHKLVDAESLPGWDRTEQEKANKARADALQCMRQIGRRQLDQIGKEDDWGT